MKCPRCGDILGDWVSFCTNCGTKLHEIIKEEIQQEMSSELKEFRTLDAESEFPTPPQWNKTTNHTGEVGKSSFNEQTAEARKAEYRNTLEEVFADGRVTPEELLLLTEKRKLLGLSPAEALEIQRETAKDLGIEIKEEGDLFTGVILEINTNKDYFTGEMNNLQFRMKNCSGDSLLKLCLSSYFEILDKREKKSCGTMRPNQQEIIRLPFKHTERGYELIEINLRYFDSKGNPSVLRTEIEVGIFARGEERGDQKNISINFTAEKIMGNDFSRMIETLEKSKHPEEKRRSILDETEKHWKWLPIFFDEEETNRWRDQTTIDKKLSEGESHFSEAENLIEDVEKFSAKDKNAARKKFEQAIQRLREAKNCFLKVRETNQEHTLSLERIRQVDRICSELEKKVGKLGPRVVIPEIRLDSACLKLDDSRKKIFLYSKEKITLGRHTQNDMILRLVPNTWKEEYDEKVRKLLKGKVEEIPVEYFQDKKNKTNLIHTVRISSTHAEIIGKAGRFYLRDVGSANGTFVEGRRLNPGEEFLLRNDTRVSVAGVLELECKFYEGFKKEQKNRDIEDSCFTVLGERSDSCFGIDKKGVINTIKFKRLNNDPEGEEYLIVIREVTIGKDRTNGIVIDGDKVSDIHARILYRGQQYWIEDLNSRYGTWVNGERIGFGVEVSLGRQAEIVIGDDKLFFEGVS